MQIYTSIIEDALTEGENHRDAQDISLWRSFLDFIVTYVLVVDIKQSLLPDAIILLKIVNMRALVLLGLLCFFIQHYLFYLLITIANLIKLAWKVIAGADHAKQHILPH